MAFKLKSRTHSQTCRESTYAEIVEIVDGVAVCNSAATRDVLMQRGYDLIEEGEDVSDVSDSPKDPPQDDKTDGEPEKKGVLKTWLSRRSQK